MVCSVFFCHFQDNVRQISANKSKKTKIFYGYIQEMEMIKKRKNSLVLSFCRGERIRTIEHLLGIKRETMEYKKDVDNLHRDWYTPHLRAKALLYNKEDVLNLIKIKRALYSRYRVPRDIEEQSTLKLTKSDINKFKTRK